MAGEMSIYGESDPDAQAMDVGDEDDVTIQFPENDVTSDDDRS